MGIGVDVKLTQQDVKNPRLQPLAYGFYLALPSFQHRRLDRMGFGEFLSIEPFWLDLALVQELQSHWDSRSGAFLFPWGHMTLTLEDVTCLTGLRVHGAALSGHSLNDYRHLVESYLDFSPSGDGDLRSIDRSEFFFLQKACLDYIGWGSGNSS